MAETGTARLIIPRPFLYFPSPLDDSSRDAGDLEKVSGGGSIRRRCRWSAGERIRIPRDKGGPLSYRNGVARSQPFNELGQLTLYAQSFPAFRFYVNFNSLRRTCEGKECVHRWVARIQPRASAKFIHDHRIGIDEISPSPLFPLPPPLPPSFHPSTPSAQ